MKKYLFIGGMARSGTSALCEMLNSHPRIALGMERYKALRPNGKLYEENVALFARERFFDWRPEDTNFPVAEGEYAGLYEKLRQKYDDATYVGDKVPNYLLHVGKLLASFPEARVILIWRPLSDVAMSWDRRSRDVSVWPRENDASAAIKAGGKVLRTVLDAVESHPNEVSLIAYEDCFRHGDESPLRLVEWLGLETGPTFADGIEMSRNRARELSERREAVRQDVAERTTNSELRALTDRLRELSI